MPSQYLVISCSLNPDSKSRVLSQVAYDFWKTTGKAAFIDLADCNLPICDGHSVYGDPKVKALTTQIEQASAILLGVPVYNFAAAASAKNLIELTGSAWNEKVVGFLCAAGGRSSYMSILGLANSLMLDFRTLINPRFVYAEGPAFDGSRLIDVKIENRIKELTISSARLAESLAASVI